MKYKSATDEFMTVKEASEAWGISPRRVAILCVEGRVPASRFNSVWAIPRNCPKPIDGRTIRYNQPVVGSVKPFLKWAGGKSQLLPEIQKYYPFDSFVTKYVEPMVGGGAVLFDILGKYKLEAVYINDINLELMDTYTIVKTKVDELVEILQQYQNEYLILDTDSRKLYYAKQRNRFNELIDSDFLGCKVEKAALMIFLNKTCFNGLYRVNRKGMFNVPMGSYKNPLICDSENLIAVSDKLQNVRIFCGDFRHMENFIDEHTFVYFDPPYRPLSPTASFTSYTSNAFDDDEQKRLAEFVQMLNAKKALVMVSNSDPKNVNFEDDFFESIYCGWKIIRVEAHRNINSKGTARGKINELLISNFKEENYGKEN